MKSVDLGQVGSLKVGVVRLDAAIDEDGGMGRQRGFDMVRSCGTAFARTA